KPAAAAAAAVALDIDLNFPAVQNAEDGVKALRGFEDEGIRVKRRRRYTAEEKGKAKVVVDDDEHLLELRLGPPLPSSSGEKPPQQKGLVEASTSPIGFMHVDEEDDDDFHTKLFTFLMYN
ncbi:hypothetical protein OWV82_018768, partial [Melia azedarach]